MDNLCIVCTIVKVEFWVLSQRTVPWKEESKLQKKQEHWGLICYQNGDKQSLLKLRLVQKLSLFAFLGQSRAKWALPLLLSLGRTTLTVHMKSAIVGWPAYLSRSVERTKHAYNSTEASGSQQGSGTCIGIISTQLVTLETYKTWLDKFLSNLLWAADGLNDLHKSFPTYMTLQLNHLIFIFEFNVHWHPVLVFEWSPHALMDTSPREDPEGDLNTPSMCE